VLNGAGGADTLVGFGGDDIYVVDNAGDVVFEGGGGGNDAVYALANYTLNAGARVERLSAIDWSQTGSLNLTGNEFANIVEGNAGANVLNGGGGNDVLVGFGGADSFVFATALGGGNVDLIADFQTGTDRIQLDDAVFGEIGGLGTLDAGAFVIGSAAGDANDRIIYNSNTGQLFFDADGTGAGAAVLFATLQGAPALSASDFLVI
jgi:Ca2+-binding RTX toxin-like protein